MIVFYYIDADEIPGCLLLLKNHIFTVRSEDTIFIFHVCGWLPTYYPITIELHAQARGRLIQNFIHKNVSRCEDDRVTGDFLDEVPSFYIDIFSELEKHPGRFAEVPESEVEKFIEGGDDHFLLFRK